MKRFALALVPLLLVACDREPVGTEVERGPALNWMNNPDNGNFRIYRSQQDLGVCWTDPATGLRACHATFPLADPGCGQGAAGPIDHQQLLIDLDAFRVAAIARGEVFMTVRDLNNAGSCFGADLVAEGLGTIRYTDNDQFFSVVNNMNAWGFIATGNLTTPGGAAVDYSGHARFVANANTFRATSLEVNVH